MISFSRKDLILLALLTLCWGLNWPIMKIGVRDFPPMTFRLLGMVGAIPVLWMAARRQRASLAIPQGKLITLIRLTIPNMFLWNILMILGVRMLSSGRAAILGYTMPIWAVLCGLLLFREKLTRLAWFGIACALAGAMLLLSSEFAAISGRPIGSLLVLLAAACWGYGTVVLKRTPMEMPTISMTFWMLVISVIPSMLLSAMFESSGWRMPDSTEWWTIIYNALIVFGFAQVVWYRLARNLPPVASSLSVMMIPVVGVFSGALILGETPHWPDYSAIVLILTAMSTVMLKPRRPQ